jgi:hypothetical protein
MDAQAPHYILLPSGRPVLLAEAKPKEVAAAVAWCIESDEKWAPIGSAPWRTKEVPAEVGK